MLNERLQLVQSSQSTITFHSVCDSITVLVVGVPAWSLLWSGSWCSGTSRLESVPTSQALLIGNFLFPQPICATCCCLWLGSTGAGSLQGQRAGERVAHKWGQQDCSRFMAPPQKLYSKDQAPVSCILQLWWSALHKPVACCTLVQLAGQPLALLPWRKMSFVKNGQNSLFIWQYEG